ncbi:MAG: 4Fe-4S dicluster domain-containing protein [Pseudomonadota bacterium]
MSTVNVETKLFQNRYLVDAEQPHIRIRVPSLCEKKCADQPCVVCCPAGCYTAEGRKVTLITDGCLECGTCRIVCLERNLDWEYPRGGYGIQYKFG